MKIGYLSSLVSRPIFELELWPALREATGRPQLRYFARTRRAHGFAAFLAAGIVLLHATGGAIAMPGPGRPTALAPFGTDSTNKSHLAPGTPAPELRDHRAPVAITSRHAIDS